MRFTDKLNKIEGNIYTVEEEIFIENGKYEGFLAHDNININTLVVYTEKGLKGDKVTNYTLSTKEGQTWKTYIEIYHPSNVYATYETSGDIVEAEDINILQDSILILNEKIKNVSLGADITKEIQDLKNKDIELENSINSKIAELVDSSPATLDTLKELADALNNDPNFATTVTNELSLKANKEYVDSELNKKSDVHTHPYKDINYIPSWEEVNNKPLEFNPSSHIHSYNELEDKPTIPIVDVNKSYVDTELKKKSDVHTHPYKSIDYVPSWDEISNKPNIPTVDITKEYVDEKLALKSDIHTHPYKSDTYVPSWYEITGKPTNATQNASGFMSDIDKIKLDGIQNNANYFSGDYNDLNNKPNCHLKDNKLELNASNSEIASLNIPTGVAPSTPTDGDMWKTSSSIQMRFNTATRTFYHNGNLGVMSVVEGQTGTATTARTVNASRLKDIIEYHSPKKISELENDLGLGGLPSEFTWSMLRGY